MVLCDFELVSEEGVYDESLCGTLEYMAPERLSQLRGNKPVRKSCDVWAIGIIAYELLMGSPPFEGEKPEQVLEEIYSGFIPGCEKLPQQAISLIKRILELNP